MEKLNLKWHTHAIHLKDMMQDLTLSDALTDVTLVSDDKRYFKAHKIVLSASSQMFKNIINENPILSPIIYLRGIESHELESILQFLYLGQATFYKDKINDFLNVAKNLEIKGIDEDNERNKLLDNDEEKVFDQINEFQINANETEATANSKQFNIIPDNNLSEDTTFIELNQKDKELSCDQCNFKTTVKRYLKRHIKGTHEENHQCDQCVYKATSRHSLERHIQSLHEHIKYPCNQCKFKASHQGNLRIHIKEIHEGVKYPCNYCDLKLSQISALKKHVKNIHENQKYPCDQCRYIARNHDNLKRHKDIIHDGFRYLCDQCSYSTTYRSALRKHVNTIHENKDAQNQ